MGGKLYFMPIVDGGSSYKFGAYLSDKSDSSTIAAFDNFRVEAESLSGRKVRRLRTDRAYELSAWKEYCHQHGIIHKFTAPYSSAQNGLAERAIHTTMDDVCTLLRDSAFGHSYWAEAASYLVHTHNLIPSWHHPGKIPLELFTGKRQDISHLRVFGARCWAKIPTVHGAQVTSGSKLDPRAVECRFLGYAGSHGNYKVQETASRHVFVSRDIVFDEGDPHRTSPSVGEKEGSLFDVTLGLDILDERTTVGQHPNQQSDQHNVTLIPESHTESDDCRVGSDDHWVDNPTEANQQTEPIPLVVRRSSRLPHPSASILQSKEYQQREDIGQHKGEEWMTDQAKFAIDLLSNDQDAYITCLMETKASHNIPQSY